MGYEKFFRVAVRLMSGPRAGRHAASTPTAPSIVDQTTGGAADAFEREGLESCLLK